MPIGSRALCVGVVTVAIAGSVAGGTAAAQSTTTPAPLTPQLQLRALLRGWGPRATRLRAVETDTHAAKLFLGNGPDGGAAQPAYLACEKGGKGERFYPGSSPAGVKVRGYPIQCVIVLAQNFDVGEVARRLHYPALHTLGTVWKL